MIILSIETSCDETALSLLDASGEASLPVFRILGNALYSQASTHAEFGGVMPSLAKREHCKNIVPLFRSVMLQGIEAIPDTEAPGTGTASSSGIGAKLALSDDKEKEIRAILAKEMDLADETVRMLRETRLVVPDCIAVTEGPGLEPALWVGINFAKALSVAFDRPIVPVNHMEGHMLSVLLGGPFMKHPEVVFPALALLISGGHTELIEAAGWHEYRLIGQTQDDALGEAFDKVARLLDLPYPGGPKISKLAAESRAENLMARLTDAGSGIRPWTLPRPMLRSPDFHFSFSGIKTAVLYAVRQKTGTVGSEAGIRNAAHAKARERSDPDELEKKAALGSISAASDPRLLTEDEKKTLAEEFENAVTEVLVHKTRSALIKTQARTLIIGGGVVANTYIRAAFEKMISESFGPEGSQPVSLFIPSSDMSTDNSIMIGAAGYLRWLHSSRLADGSGIHHPGSASHASMTARGNLSL